MQKRPTLKPIVLREPSRENRVVVIQKKKKLNIFTATSHRKTGIQFIEEVIQLAIEVSSALGFVHAQGYCHGDIKPSNVLIADDGHAKLLDFNLAYSVNQDLKRLGGTLPYMAPEQLQSVIEKNNKQDIQIGAKADLFQFGATIYELLTGRLPFGEIPNKKGIIAIATGLRDRQKIGPELIRNFNPSVDQKLATLIESCLAFDPDSRPLCAESLTEEFKKLLSPQRKILRYLGQYQGIMLSLLATTLLFVFLIIYRTATLEPYAIRQLKKAGNFRRKRLTSKQFLLFPIL